MAPGILTGPSVAGGSLCSVHVFSPMRILTANVKLY